MLLFSSVFQVLALGGGNSAEVRNLFFRANIAVMVRLHLECCALFWAPAFKKDTEVLKPVPTRAVKVMKDLKTCLMSG